jgi:hypothetical protein
VAPPAHTNRCEPCGLRERRAETSWAGRAKKGGRELDLHAGPRSR